MLVLRNLSQGIQKEPGTMMGTGIGAWSQRFSLKQRSQFAKGEDVTTHELITKLVYTWADVGSAACLTGGYKTQISATSSVTLGKLILHLGWAVSSHPPNGLGLISKGSHKDSHYGNTRDLVKKYLLWLPESQSSSFYSMCRGNLLHIKLAELFDNVTFLFHWQPKQE